MMQTVQLAIADGMYAAALREALSHSCAWQIESVSQPDFSRHCVMVLDQAAFERLLLPLSNPERIVLITHRNPTLMAEAWEAGIVSVVSEQDPMSTVLLAIMAAGLRVDKPHGASHAGGPLVGNAGGFSPSSAATHASLPPDSRGFGSKRSKTH